MDKNKTNRIGSINPPWLSSFIFLLVAFIGFAVIGPIIGSLLAMIFYEGNPLELQQKLINPGGDESVKSLFFLVQGSATGIGLIIIPWLYLKFIDRKPFAIFSPNTRFNPLLVLLSIVVVWFFMVVNSVFIEWNESMSMPDVLKDLEIWMRNMEERGKKITTFLTTFNTTGQFVVGLIVIGVLPAIGEELVFRGYIQTELRSAFNNHHVAIWVAAILFSAIHMQFFGFIPRMLLGALFGYLYYWSGNLTYPVIAHFIQNGSQVILLYLAQKGVIDIDMDSPESFSTGVIIIFSLFTLSAIYYFRKIALNRNEIYG